MRQILIVILCMIIVALLWYLYLLKNGIEKITMELEEISTQLQENRVVKLPFPSKALEALLSAVNQNLNAIRKEHLQLKKREKDFRQQVENISHDIRTPLTAIIGYLRMMEKENLTTIDAEYLEIAIKRSERMQELTNQFYELSQVSNPDFSMKLKEINVAHLVRESCLSQYSVLENANMEVELQIPDINVCVWGNEDALERVISNLIQNASRYGKKKLFVTLCQEEDKVTLTLKNDVNEDKIEPEPEKLFQRFYMQESSRTCGGSGLGLSISKELVSHMNGKISAGYEEVGEEWFLKILVELKKVGRR